MLGPLLPPQERKGGGVNIYSPTFLSHARLARYFSPPLISLSPLHPTADPPQHAISQTFLRDRGRKEQKKLCSFSSRVNGHDIFHFAVKEDKKKEDPQERA